MKSVDITYLNGLDVERLALTDDEILGAVEEVLKAQGLGQTVIEPRVHLVPESSDIGHFNVLRGVVKPMGLAGVKVVGDFVGNYRRDLPSEMAVLNLFDPETGMPKAFLDATAITEMRTGAVTALGGKYLARKGSKILGHIGARGTAYWNVRLLDRIFDFDEIRVHSKRPESQKAFADKLAADLGKPIRQVDTWEDCVRDADIVVEASRLPAPEPLLKTAWIKRGALAMPYGTMSSVELSLTDIMDKMVVDDWGPVPQGAALRGIAGARRQRPAERGDASCRDRADRGGAEARARARRRDDPVLASGPEPHRHRARSCAAREGARAGDRAVAALLMRDGPKPRRVRIVNQA